MEHNKNNSFISHAQDTTTVQPSIYLARIHQLFVIKSDGLYSPCATTSGDRIPVEARFSAPVKTGPGSHLASYKMDTVSFPWVKRPERGTNDPPPSSAEIKERVELYLYSLSLGLHGLF